MFLPFPLIRLPTAVANISRSKVREIKAAILTAAQAQNGLS